MYSALLVSCDTLCLHFYVLYSGLPRNYVLFMAPYSPKALRYCNALSRDLTVLPAHPPIYPQIEWTISAFAFPVEAGTHLPTPKGWKAELAGKPERWVNSQPRTATRCLSRLLTGQSMTPHWASSVRSLPRAAAQSGRGWSQPTTFSVSNPTS